LRKSVIAGNWKMHMTCAEALGHKEFVMTKLYRSA